MVTEIVTNGMTGTVFEAVIETVVEVVSYDVVLIFIVSNGIDRT